MALDPLVKEFLDQQPPLSPPWEQSEAEARAGFREMVKANGPKDVPIGKVETLTIAGPGGPLALRLYTPVAAGSEALPALVFFHGGAFRVGDFESHETLCREFAGEAGCRVIAVDYRLAPEHPFPAAYDDAYAALGYIEANAAALGIDPNRIAVGGDSAGGALAAAICQRAKAEAGATIVYQLLLFPVTQLGGGFPSMQKYAEGFQLERVPLEYCYKLYASESQWRDPKLSPLLASDLSGLPPAYVMLAEYDVLHDEGLAYGEKLRAAGVTVTIAEHPGMIHDFILFGARFPQARASLVEAAKALKGVFDTI
ncbi:acetyl esterase [Rhizomicrobium palustre]|uniref:Acetyl esterase n=1 Tax=Rhizomicrobium palustre TaxID=189966 RepID=A0A846N4C7_9PROT|nr:alpha/beta hydrolase [Rhizomicrobium palustre]NIK90369.1 acetyl esterase [Rhizomicrobium palustre]